ncbi:sodium-dependent lysophosphatidylcholine symporter 1-A isoform X5 [Tachysurus fulvidraco]|uniref:sodium-dependent lysophosphatidylcholine symporter 1-A isoform X5 n=1 Tax=Tachysurus fulvidraco TaxID=1234273 RepID=UPI001FEEC319|nr:sodium-dependent lysophosphatidylcholine symporter 1-A isoform X5 [Tachysurus fulvidraco]
MAPEEDVENPVSLLPPAKHIGNDGLEFIQQKKRTLGMSVCSKLCFAIGGAPYQITGSALGFFLQIYLLDVAQLEPFYASIILFAGRVWDAVTDPTVGFLVSRSQWTRHGRMMPWILISTPFAVLSYFLIWVVPPVEKGKVLWYLFFYCMFQSLQTCFHVPYSTLTMFISSEQKERDSATAYRMTVEVFGTVLGTAIQGQIVGGATAPCLNYTSFLNDSNNVMQLNSMVNVSHVTLEDTKQAYMIASGVISVIYIICAAVLFFGVREQEDVSIVKAECLSFVESLKLLQKHGPYVKLVTGFLFTSMAFMLMEGNFALFLTYTLGLRGDFQNILLVIMEKMKPKATVSMLPDAVDDYKVQNPSSQGHEAIFFSFYVFFTKFASGVSLGISTLSLHFAGYMSRGCVQPDSVKLTLKLLVSAVPVSFIILGLLIFRSYPINEERRRHNRQRLHALLHDSSDDSETSRLPGSSI